MSTIIGIAILLIVIAAAIWASRTPPSSGAPDNLTAVSRYGRG